MAENDAIAQQKSSISHIPPNQPIESQKESISAPTQLFLGDISEEKRLSIKRFRYDEYFEKEGWKKRWGGDWGQSEDGLEPILKTIALKEDELWDLAGHIAFKEKHDRPELIVLPYLQKASRMPYVVRSSYLTAVCTLLNDKHGLGLRQKYKSQFDDLMKNVDYEDNGHDEPDDEYELQEESDAE